MEKNYATDPAEQQLIEFVASHLKNYLINPGEFEKAPADTRHKILRAINNEEILRAIKSRVPLGVYDNSLHEGVYIKRRTEKFDRSIFPFTGTGPQKNKKEKHLTKKKYYIMKDENYAPQYLLRTYWIEEPIETKDNWMELILVYQGEPKRDQKKKGSTSGFDNSNDINIKFPDKFTDLVSSDDNYHNL
jgi:hypothetical protein